MNAWLGCNKLNSRWSCYGSYFLVNLVMMNDHERIFLSSVVYPIKYRHGLFCCVVVCCGFILPIFFRVTSVALGPSYNWPSTSKATYGTHILQCCFTGTGAIKRLPQCQWSNPEEYGKTDDMNPLRNYDITTINKAQYMHVLWDIMHLSVQRSHCSVGWAHKE